MHIIGACLPLFRSSRKEEISENAAKPPKGVEMFAANTESVKQSAADVFGKLERSFDDITAAIRGKPNKVTSRCQSIKTEVTTNGKPRKVKGEVKTREVELNLMQFIDNPLKGQLEKRCNNCLRTLMGSLDQIRQHPEMPGHEQLAGSDNTPSLLDKIVCTDERGPIPLRDFSIKNNAERIETKLMEERAAGKNDTETALLGAMDDLRKIGREHYLRDEDAPLDVLEGRLAAKQHQLQAASESRDVHGSYQHKAVAGDENEIQQLRQSIKTLKEIIFARHHQEQLENGGDNKKLAGKGTVRRLYYAMKRSGAADYLAEGERSPLQVELRRLNPLGGAEKNKKPSVRNLKIGAPMQQDEPEKKIDDKTPETSVVPPPLDEEKQSLTALVDDKRSMSEVVRSIVSKPGLLDEGEKKTLAEFIELEKKELELGKIKLAMAEIRRQREEIEKDKVQTKPAEPDAGTFTNWYLQNLQEKQQKLRKT